MSSVPMTLNLDRGSVAFRFTPNAARDLQVEIATLMQHLKAAAAAAGARPQPQPATEYRFTGDVFFEVFCNPNIYPSPFAAKVLVTLRDDRIRLSSEAELTQLVEDLNAYLEQSG
ncbi:hypothetical protein KR51_00025260 [Rubidibacter lacunae KORDI 51-2]|uniref:Uncharacterized protein n=1 Tax=Rubidibacter lacunae KORDI 51-2 TaxID=582515 RepID=U5DJ05_9CHRO|nr:hypothetical protein [Rubidibacter lacunae]ERN40917.1 hypothetical protein KR51_00025260 [Rubidibacter lacunae KORDI 51-2]